MRGPVILLALGLASGCAGGAPKKGGEASTCDGGDTVVAIVNELTFGRSEGGVGVGFDLDGRVSDATDTQGCKKPDLVDPDGTEGVDSAFAALVPVLEATQAAAVEGLIHDSIRSGELLLALELTGVDDRQDDDCIGMSMIRAQGVPLVGTDGNLLDAQTFERHAEIAPGTTTAGWIDGGRFHAEGLSMQLELQVLDEFLEFTVHGGQIRGTMNDDGSVSGAFAGGIPVSEILYEFDIGDIGDLRELIQQAIPVAADLYDEETGQCDAISITFEYDALPAYLFEE